MADDPQIIQDFAQSLSTKDSKTVSAYLSALRGFKQWLSTKPGGDPFTPEAVTTTAVNSYLNYLKTEGRAPRTRSQALTALRRFCLWAIGRGYMTYSQPGSPPHCGKHSPTRTYARTTICTQEPG